MSVRLGDRVSIDCRATGHPEPTIVWTSLVPKPLTVVDGSLVFEAVDAAVEGRYRCEASNGAGDVASKVIEIRVNGTGGQLPFPFRLICLGSDD